MPITAHRLARQLIARQPLKSPAAVVAWFGAIQAQDYLAALWALGLRTPKAAEGTIEAAIADGSVIRTHAFRGTWQYVTPGDLRWMLGLVGARVIAASASRYRELELDPKTLMRCEELFARALSGGKQLTRAEMARVLTQRRVPAVNRRLIHILGHAELDGVICSGGRRGKQPTFALLDDRVPRSRPISHDEALARIASRYFQSRGPATDRDLAWWTGLPLTMARRAIDLSAGGLESAMIDGERYWFTGGAARPARSPDAHLLPAFDEYLVGYQNRSAMLDPRHLRKVNAGGGMLKPAVVVDGRVVGTWRRVLEKGSVSVTALLFEPPSAVQHNAITKATDRYAGFLGLTPRLVIRR